MTIIALTTTALLIVFLAGGLWVGLALGATGTALLFIFKNVPLDRLLAQYSWNILTTQELLALPMFIVMGEILFRSKLSRSLFEGLAPWAGLVPGRLLHVNVFASTIFAAISGSSAATVQVVGRMSVTELLRRGYSKRIVLGSLAGAGTLGFLIPPSNMLIVYGVLANVSIIQLFAGGLLPGLVLASGFSLWIILITLLRPELVPQSDRELSSASLRQRVAALKDLIPVFILIALVFGSMYGGIATPSESAAIGVAGALLIAFVQGGLDRTSLAEIALSSVRTCAMIAAILLGATILANVMAFLGLPTAAAEWVASLGLPPLGLIAALVALYLVLGCFLDGFSMMVLTLPIVIPMITAAGYNSLWFGIFIVVVIEMAQITPPVGFNLFILKGLSGEKLSYVARAALPYLLIMIAFTILLAIFPEIALWLPDTLQGR